ncbi:hypothetical protein ACO0LO_19990 [Undibacterium sp. TJN25]|uniref:hypothetical protein n=1 Tax=Undibacterium sp. TJN25 TaxID=3413056 RepID=UPI003BF30B81
MVHSLPASICKVEILHSEGRISKSLIASAISLTQTNTTLCLSMKIAQQTVKVSRQAPSFKDILELTDAPALMKSLQFAGDANDDVLRSLQKQFPHTQWKLSLDLGQGDVIVYAVELALYPFYIALRVVKLEKRSGPMQNLHLNWPSAPVREGLQQSV